jgi:hypothetical protein
MARMRLGPVSVADRMVATTFRRGGFQTLPYEARPTLGHRLGDQMPSTQLAVLSVEA